MAAQVQVRDTISLYARTGFCAALLSEFHVGSHVMDRSYSVWTINLVSVLSFEQGFSRFSLKEESSQLNGKQERLMAGWDSLCKKRTVYYARTVHPTLLHY